MLEELLLGNITQDEYFNQNDILLLSDKLPFKVYGCVFLYRDRYCIVINQSLSDNKKKKAILHEIAHIELNHIYKRKHLLELKIEGLEDEADEYINKILQKLSI